jgi:hypothetical protein
LVRRMSVMFMEVNENPTRLTVCPKCGKQVRIDEDCDCERLFLAHYMQK